MKMHSLFLLIFIILVTACAPQSIETPSPTPVITNTPFATTTPQPTQTLEPTPIPSIHAEKIPLGSCGQIIEAKISGAGVLEVVYETYDRNLTTWSEDTQVVFPIPFPLLPDALDPKLSIDHRSIIFGRDSGESQSELWVMDVDGQNEKRLATLQYEVGRTYGYDWVPNTNKIFYYAGEPFQYDVWDYDKFVVVDVNSGRAISLKMPPEVIATEFAPDGSQMAIRTENELRVLSMQDGRVQFTIQARLNYPRYSPDGKYIFYFIDKGILRIDAMNGQQQIIPLKYTIMTYSPVFEGYFETLPSFRWVGDSTLLVASLDSDQRYVARYNETNPNSWTFKVWQVDLTDGTTHPSRSFSGDPSSVIFSTDGNRFAFFKIELSDSPESLHLASLPGTLYLADLNTGEILETIKDGHFEAWQPDSSQYIYSTGHPKIKDEKDHTQYYLGKVGGESSLMDGSAPDYLSGLDSEWIAGAEWTVTNCQIIHITP